MVLNICKKPVGYNQSNQLPRTWTILNKYTIRKSTKLHPHSLF